MFIRDKRIRSILPTMGALYVGSGLTMDKFEWCFFVQYEGRQYDGMQGLHTGAANR